MWRNEGTELERHWVHAGEGHACTFLIMFLIAMSFPASCPTNNSSCWTASVAEFLYMSTRGGGGWGEEGEGRGKEGKAKEEGGRRTEKEMAI